MSRIYGLILYVCGGMTLSLLAVGVVATTEQHARANVGDPQPVEEEPVNGADCDILGFIFPCSYFTDCKPSTPTCAPVPGTSYCHCV